MQLYVTLNVEDLVSDSGQTASLLCWSSRVKYSAVGGGGGGGSGGGGGGGCCYRRINHFLSSPHTG